MVVTPMELFATCLEERWHQWDSFITTNTLLQPVIDEAFVAMVAGPCGLGVNRGPVTIKLVRLIQGAFCLCAQQMREGVTVQRRLSLAGRIHGMIPVDTNHYLKYHPYLLAQNGDEVRKTIPLCYLHKVM